MTLDMRRERLWPLVLVAFSVGCTVTRAEIAVTASAAVGNTLTLSVFDSGGLRKSEVVNRPRVPGTLVVVLPDEADTYRVVGDDGNLLGGATFTSRPGATVKVALALGSDMLDGDGDRVPVMQDNCPTAKNATQADVDRDGRGDACDGHVGPAALCPPTATVCEDFEGAMGWGKSFSLTTRINTTIEVTDAESHSGGHALHVGVPTVATGNAEGAIQTPVADATVIDVRFWLKLPSVLSSDGAGVLRLPVVGDNNKAVALRLDNGNQSQLGWSSSNLTVSETKHGMPGDLKLGQWNCIELSYDRRADSATPGIRVWIEDQPLEALTSSQQFLTDPGISGAAIGTYSDITPDGYDYWIDDIAIGTDRLYCN